MNTKIYQPAGLVLMVSVMAVACLEWLACRTPMEQMLYYQGSTMGTTYHVRIYHSGGNRVLEEKLKIATDSLLYGINQGISTYDRNSVISYFNNTKQHSIVFPGSDSIQKALPHFFNNLRVAFRVYELSGGLFDPTVMPLVNYWGFGYSGRHQVLVPDTVIIGDLLKRVGLNKINYTYDSLTHAYTLFKSDSTMELDFGGIGQGYGADQIAGLLNSYQLDNYLVELGGELVAKGNKPDGSPFIVGLNTPLEQAGTQDVFSKVLLKDKALTTSGNYRNFYKSGDQTYSHTINPFTGFPERSTLLSVSLIGPDCTSIDAMATACMAMGIQRSRDIVVAQGMEAYFIYRNSDSLMVEMTPGFKAYLTK